MNCKNNNKSKGGWSYRVRSSHAPDKLGLDFSPVDKICSIPYINKKQLKILIDELTEIYDNFERFNVVPIGGEYLIIDNDKLDKYNEVKSSEDEVVGKFKEKTVADAICDLLNERKLLI